MWSFCPCSHTGSMHVRFDFKILLSTYSHSWSTCYSSTISNCQSPDYNGVNGLIFKTLPQSAYLKLNSKCILLKYRYQTYTQYTVCVHGYTDVVYVILMKPFDTCFVTLGYKNWGFVAHNNFMVRIVTDPIYTLSCLLCWVDQIAIQQKQQGEKTNC